MEVERIQHIGIATHSIEESLLFYRDLLGLTVDACEDVPDQGARVAKVAIGETHLELLEPLTADGPVARFLRDHGPGVHHIAFRTRNLHADLAFLRDKGVRLVDASPRPGSGGMMIAFLHPSSTGKVFTELCQP